MYTIAAISDVHIRVRSRHREYTLIFRKLIKQLQRLQPDYIFNLGDTYHQKLNLSPEAITLTRWLFRELGKIAPVVTIIGNHDVNLTNLDRPNSVIASLEDIPNQIILAKSGYHQLEPDLGIGHFSILEDPETWPVKLSNVRKKSINIGLYHGAVNTSHNDSGFAIDHSIRSDDYFGDYDFVMCGDIHKTEQLDTDGRIWMTGDLIQQNFGESDDKGFLVWRIQSKDEWDVEKVKIKNEYNYITVNIEDADLEENKKEIQRTLKRCGVTTKSNVRIKLSSNNMIDSSYKESIKQFVINEFSVTPIISDVFVAKSGDFVLNDSDNSSVNFSDTTIQAELIKNYVEECMRPDQVNMSDLLKINEELNREINSVSDSKMFGLSWEPMDLKLSNIFCFGEDISLNFQNDLNGLIGLFGKNASGKSSLFSALTFAIFGVPIKKMKIGSVVRMGTSLGETDITIRKGDVIFRIRRSVSNLKNGKYIRNKVNFEVYKDDKWESLNEETIPDTNKEITKYFGTYEDFVMTSMSTQKDYNIFIGSGNANRKDVVMKNLGLGVFRELHELAVDKIKKLNNIIDEIDDTEALIIKLDQLQRQIRELKDSSNDYDEIIEDSIDQLKKINAKLDEKKKKLKPVSDTIVDPLITQKKLDKAKSSKQKMAESLVNLEDTQTKLNLHLEKIDANLSANTEKLQEITNSIRTISSEAAVLNNNIKRLESKSVQGEIVDCKDHSCALFKIYNEDMASLSSLREQLDSKEKELESLEEQEKIYRLNIKLISKDAEIKERINSVKKDISHEEKDIQWYTDRLEDYKKNEHAFKFNESINADIERLEKGRQFAESKKIKAEAQKEVDKRLVSEYEDRQEEINDTLNKISEMKKKLFILDQYRNIMNPNALPNVLLSSYINIFESEVNRILGSSTELSVNVDLNIKKGAKNAELEMTYANALRNTNYMPVELASGAEEMLLSLAIRVALINITAIQKSNILVIDEGFGTLHFEWISTLKNMFESFKDMFSSIIIVSHLDTIQDLPDKIITTEKIDGVSQLIT